MVLQHCRIWLKGRVFTSEAQLKAETTSPQTLLKISATFLTKTGEGGGKAVLTSIKNTKSEVTTPTRS